MGFKKPEYPVILTEANWKSNKGLFAKMAGETGIGELLREAMKAFNAVNWQLFRLSEVAEGQGIKRKPEDIVNAYNNALKQKALVDKADSALRDVERKSGKLAEEWKKSKSIPSSSVKHVLALHAAAKALSYEVAFGTTKEKLDKEKAECEEGLRVLHAEHRKIHDRLKTYASSSWKGLPDVTLESYPVFWKEHIRGVGTSLPVVAKEKPEFDPEWKVWKAYSNKLVQPATQTELDDQKKVLKETLRTLIPKLKNL